jgi:uncharacterized protein YjbJ (UPF0337 family)
MSGILDKLKGRFKEGVGEARGDDKLKAEGKLQQFSGDVKQTGSRLKHDAEHKVDDVLEDRNHHDRR